MNCKSEMEYQIEFTEALKNRGWLTFGIVHPPQPGYPDVEAFKDGRCAIFEIKKRGGRLSPEQERMHKLLRGHGVYVYVVSSPASAEAVLNMLDERFG
ncbi:hypothetical protein AGMMS49992_07450 [Clostridia bacterium]|nr:hypothetical protein AGMMS49992_07450 [Clostridia bacterium]